MRILVSRPLLLSVVCAIALAEFVAGASMISYRNGTWPIGLFMTGFPSLFVYWVLTTSVVVVRHGKLYRFGRGKEPIVLSQDLEFGIDEAWLWIMLRRPEGAGDVRVLRVPPSYYRGEEANREAVRVALRRVRDAAKLD